jgi:3-dehydroquinate dehydratase
MRRTTHQIECDRCGATATVRSWSYTDLTRADLERLGWTRYVTWHGANQTPSKDQIRSNVKDLCLACTAIMKAVAHPNADNSWLVLVASLESMDEDKLLETRIEINRQLRKLRGQ